MNMVRICNALEDAGDGLHGEMLDEMTESIAKVIWDKLRSRLDDRYDIAVKLYETPRNFVVYTG